MRSTLRRVLLFSTLALLIAGSGPTEIVAQSEGEPQQRRRAPQAEPEDPKAIVHMSFDSKGLTVGGRLSLAVVIDAATEVNHVPFHIRVNPAVLRFENGQEGEFLGGDGGQTAFFARVTSDGAEVVVGLSRLGREKGVKGKGELCRLEFVAVGTGDAGLSFRSASVRDNDNKVVEAAFRPTRVQVR
jgi:hypothetical protein